MVWLKEICETPLSHGPYQPPLMMMKEEVSFKIVLRRKEGFAWKLKACRCPCSSRERVCLCARLIVMMTDNSKFGPLD